GQAAECFCPALRFALDAEGQITPQRLEPLAADVRAGRDGWWNARLKLVAGLIGVDFDDLKQREKMRRRWRAVQIAAAVLVLAFAAAGSRLVTPSFDGNVRIWNVEAARTERVLSTGPRSRHVIFSPSGDRVAAAGDDGSIRIFDANSGALVRRLDGHESGRIV